MTRSRPGIRRRILEMIERVEQRHREHLASLRVRPLPRGRQRGATLKRVTK